MAICTASTSNLVVSSVSSHHQRPYFSLYVCVVSTKCGVVLTDVSAQKGGGKEEKLSKVEFSRGIRLIFSHFPSLDDSGSHLIILNRKRSVEPCCLVTPTVSHVWSCGPMACRFSYRS
jgi:hypothetical protein